MSAGRAVTVGILGPLQVESGGNTLGPRDFGGRKPKQLLEILALHRGVAVHKERLAELLWGERQPRDAMRTLEAYVSVVRHVLGRTGALNVIRTGQGSYRLDTIAAELDLTRFDRLTNDARSGEAVGRLVLRRRALALVRGELLADEPYADWAAPLRGLYQERWRTLMLDTAEDCLAVSDPGAAAAYWPAFSRSNPPVSVPIDFWWPPTTPRESRTWRWLPIIAA